MQTWKSAQPYVTGGKKGKRGKNDKVPTVPKRTRKAEKRARSPSGIDD
jgi:hypothetical protein